MALLLVISVVIMTVDHRQNHLDGIRSGLSILLSPIHYLVNLPFATIGWMGEVLVSQRTLQARIHMLNQQANDMTLKLQKLQTLEQENIRLRELLQSSRKDWEQVLIAELIAVDLDPFQHLVQINKGSHAGVYKGHPILDAHGIMGQVIHVNPLSSTAILLTDPNHAIPVRINRNGYRAIAIGTGEPDLLDIPHIPNSADIVVGDLLISSGLGGRFPQGYPVATIIRIKTNPTEPYATVNAMPIANLESAQEVLLVWNQIEDNAEESIKVIKP